METKHTRGRGSNPKSRANLTGPKRDTHVYNRGGGIGWGWLAGPMTARQADAWVKRLEKFNSTGKTLFESGPSRE